MWRGIAQSISLFAIIGTIVPSISFLMERIDLARCQWLMLVATIIWFAVTPFWMGQKPGDGRQRQATDAA